MKKFIALILALVMILSLSTVAFAGAKPDTIFPFNDDEAFYDSDIRSNGGLEYNDSPYGSLARILVNTITYVFTGKGDHVIGFHGIDKIGLADYHDDTVNAIANGIHDMINSIGYRIYWAFQRGGELNPRLECLVNNIYGFANKVGGAYAFFFSFNGRGIEARQ